MKNYIPLLLCCIMAVAIVSCSAQTGSSLPPADFEKSIGQGDVQILDVRTAGEYASGHIKGALLADWNNPEEFNRRSSFIDKTKPLLVYCLSGGRSAAAAAKMRKEGYEKVYELKGGILAWKKEGKPLEGKSDQQPMTAEAFNSAISSAATVLVDFGAEWCPPCKKMELVLKSLQQNNPGKFVLIKVDGGNDEAVLKANGVSALPVFILYKNGRQVWRKNGVATEKEIAEHL